MAVSKAFKRATGLAMAIERSLQLRYESRRLLFGKNYEPAQKFLYIAMPNGKACSTAGIEFNSQMLKDLEFDDVCCQFGADKRWRCWAVRGVEKPYAYGLFYPNGVTDNAEIWKFDGDAWTKYVEIPNSAENDIWDCTWGDLISVDSQLWIALQSSHIVIRYDGENWSKLADMPPKPYTGEGTVDSYIMKTAVYVDNNKVWFGFREKPDDPIIDAIWELDKNGIWTRLNPVPTNAQICALTIRFSSGACWVQSVQKYFISLEESGVRKIFSFNGGSWEDLGINYEYPDYIYDWYCMVDMNNKIWGVPEYAPNYYGGSNLIYTKPREHNLAYKGGNKVLSTVDIFGVHTYFGTSSSWNACGFPEINEYWYMKVGTKQVKCFDGENWDIDRGELAPYNLGYRTSSRSFIRV